MKNTFWHVLFALPFVLLYILSKTDTALCLLSFSLGWEACQITSFVKREWKAKVWYFTVWEYIWKYLRLKWFDTIADILAPLFTYYLLIKVIDILFY